MKIEHDGQTLILVKSEYQVGGRMVVDIYTEDGELYAEVTTNLPNQICGAKQAYIDTNNLEPELYNALKGHAFIGPEPISFASSGYCTYPLHEILI